MMSWCHIVLCQLIPGEYRWIYLNVSRRNKLEGKQYQFLKSIQDEEHNFFIRSDRSEIKNGENGQRWS